MGVRTLDGGLNFVTGIDLSGFDRDAAKLQNRISGVSNAAVQQSKLVEEFANKAAQAAAAYFSIASATNFIGKLVQVRGEFEQLGVAYATILGSKEKADALFDQTVNLAKTTPFELTELAKATKQLLAYGFSADEVTGTLSKLGDVAAGVSAPIGDIAYLYGTLKTQGRAYAQDIRQFTGRGIPIIAELAKQFHTTSENVNALVEAGKIGFPQIEIAFNNLTGSGGQFFRLMEKQSATLTGQISNLSDAFDIMLNEIGKDNDGILKGTVANLSSIVRNYKDVVDIIETLIITYGSYRAALIATSALEGFRSLRTVTDLVQKFNGASFVTVAVTRELTVAQTLQAAATNIQGKALAFLRSEAFLTATAIGAVTAAITIIGASVYAWVEASKALNEAQEHFNEISKTTRDSLVSEKIKVADLVAIARDHNNTLAQRSEAVKKLNDMSPEYLGNITLETINTRGTIKAIEDYLVALDRKLAGEAAYSLKLENSKRIADLKARGKDAIGSTEYAGLALQDFATESFSNDAPGRIVDKLIKTYEDANKKINAVYGQQIKDNLTTGTKGTDAQIMQALEFQRKLKDVITNFNGLLKTATGKKDLEAIQKALNEALDVPNISRQKIAQIQAMQTDVENALAVYSRKTQKKLSDQEESEQDRRNRIFEKVAQLNADALAESKTQDEKEVLQAREKYDKLIREIERFNANKKNKTNIDPTKVKLNGVVTNLVANADDAEAGVRAKQSFELEKAGFDAQKILFNEYEKYKLEVGSRLADERFKKELNGATSYVNYLEGLLKSVEGKTDKRSVLMQDYLKTALPAARNQAVKDQQDVLSKLLQDNLDYETKRQSIIEKAEAQILTLRQAGNNAVADQVATNTETTLTSLDQANVETKIAYKELFDGLVTITEKAARQNSAALRKRINDGIKAGTITKEAYLKIKQQLDELDKGLDESNIQKIIVVSNTMKTIAQSVGVFSQGLANALSTAADLASSFASIKTNFKALGSDKSSGLEKLTAGLGIVGSAIGIFTTIYGIFDRSKEHAEQLAYANNLQAKAIEAVNRELERNAKLNDKAYGQQRIEGYIKLLKDITKIQAEQNEKLQGRLSLTGSKILDEEIAKRNSGQKKNPFLDEVLAKFQAIGRGIDISNKSLAELNKLMDEGMLDEETSKLVQSLIDLQEQAIATQNALTEDLTGTSFDGLVDGVLGLFENLTISAEDFSKNFEKIIRTGLLNAFKRNYLEKQLQDFYTLFDKLTQAAPNNVLTASDIAQLEDKYNSIIGKAKTQFDNIQKIAGDTFGTNDQANSLQGSIKASLTDETGTILAGTLKGIQQGIYDLNLTAKGNSLTYGQMLSVAQDTLNVIIQVELNTRRSADNTDNLPAILSQLQGINGNTKGNFDLITRAAGVFKF